MLLRTILIACVVAAAATQIPGVIQLTEAPAPAAGKVENVSQTQPSLPSGTVLMVADQLGHFSGEFRMNGRPVEGLVDTGASTIAINESTARRLGYTANGLDFRHPVMTANGRTEAARITLTRVEIGNVRVTDVDAMVLRDKALSGTLVGMSFLRKLKSFQVENGRLRLVQ